MTSATWGGPIAARPSTFLELAAMCKIAAFVVMCAAVLNLAVKVLQLVAG